MSSFPTTIFQIFMLFISFVAVSHQIAAQDIGFYFNNNRQKVTIPVEVHNNLIVLPVDVNDTAKLRLILDTGARSTILFDKDLADSLGMKYLREIEIFGAGSQQPVAAQVVDEVSLSMPGISSSRIPALVLKEDFVQLDRHLGTRVDGLIGYDIFSRFVVKLDYQRERLTLYDPGQFSIGKKYTTVNLQVRDSKPIMDLDIHFDCDNQFLGHLMVDTGATHALALDHGSSESIELPEKYISASLGRGLSGEIAGYIGRIKQVDMGIYYLEDVITSFAENFIRNDGPKPLRNGSIGGELLKKFTVIFDFVRGEMHLKPNRLFQRPFEYNITGIEFTAHGKDLDTFMIHSVRAQSVADQAGFMPGDVLVSINNLPSDEFNLSRIYDELNSDDGDRIDLTVLRDGNFISKAIYIKREF